MKIYQKGNSSFLILWKLVVKEIFEGDVFLFHCVKCVRIRSYSGPYFPAFRLNTERYGVSLLIQSECGKIRTRITPNTDTFHAVVVSCNCPVIAITVVCVLIILPASSTRPAKIIKYSDFLRKA